MPFDLPPVINNVEGEQRSVGFEIEFAGIEPYKAAEIIASLYGGKIQKEHRYQIIITECEIGEFRVELDARILRKMADNDLFAKLGLNLDQKSLGKSIEDVVDKLARTVVPLEIVMPPVAMTELSRLEELREALQRNKAEGTNVSLVHAFGMHMNIEVPNLETSTLLDYLRAFMVVYPWLLQVLDIDISRRISPFVDPFPDKYVRKVLATTYDPDREQFIQDYIEYNPTRNRPIDLMPIFALLSPNLIKSVMEEEKNAPRPTFHYRLPNSRIDNSEWSFETEWNYWLVIERLTADKEMLRKLSQLYRLRKKKTTISFRKEWAKTIAILLDLDEE